MTSSDRPLPARFRAPLRAACAVVVSEVVELTEPIVFPLIGFLKRILGLLHSPGDVGDVCRRCRLFF